MSPLRKFRRLHGVWPDILLMFTAVLIVAVPPSSLSLGGGSPPSPVRGFAPAVHQAGSIELADALASLNSSLGPYRPLGSHLHANWTALNLPTLFGGLAAYDAADGYVVAWNAVQSGKANATWILNGTNWSLADTPTAPKDRYGASFAYDPVDQGVLLFGGMRFSKLLNDTWLFRAGRWSEVNTTGKAAPSPRMNASLSYDGVDNTMVLFGGTSTNCTHSTALNCTHPSFNDTWEFSKGVWSAVTPKNGTAPSPRFAAGAAFHAGSRGMVLYGGEFNVRHSYVQIGNLSWRHPHNRTIVYWTQGALNDTWMFAGGQWTNVTGAGRAPPARGYVHLADEGTQGGLLLVLQSSIGCGIAVTQTWRFSNGTWVELQARNVTTSSCPYGGYAIRASAPRFLYPIVADPQVGGVLLLGDPLWHFTGVNWSVVQPSSDAPWSDTPLMVWDAADGYVLLFDAWTQPEISGWPYSTGPNSQTWTFSNGTWTNITSRLTISPPGRFGGAMTYDAADQCVVLFGGVNTGGYSLLPNTTWTYRAGNWTARNGSVAHAPVSLYQPSLAYDASDGYVVMFGGSPNWGPYLWNPGITFVNETWRFSGGVWSNVTPRGSVAPRPRMGAGFAYDPSQSSVVLFGGIEGNSTGAFLTTDTWEYAGGTWKNVTAGTAPSAAQGTLVYDARAKQVLLFGGLGHPDLWAFNGSRWHVVPTTGIESPNPQPVNEVVYVPSSGSDLMLGVLGADSVWWHGDAWMLSVT